LYELLLLPFAFVHNNC